MKYRNSVKKPTSILLAMIILFSLVCLSGCDNKQSKNIENIEQLNSPDYTISVHAGSAAALTATKTFPNAEIVYNNAISDAYLAVAQGKSDAFVYGKLYMQYAVASESLENLTIMNQTLDTADIAVGINPKKENLLVDINAFIKKIKADGTLKEMYDRWVVKADKTMPQIDKPTNPEITLKMGTSGLVEPMNYFDENQELTGFDVEFIKRLALFLNADIQLEAMSFDALVASLESGRLDAVVSDLNITEERKQVILMSDPYMTSETGVLVQADRLGESAKSKITSIDQIKGSKIGILAGSSYDKRIAKLFPDSELVSTASYADSIAALKNGRIHTYITDEPIARFQIAAVDGITYLPNKLTEDDYGFVLSKDNTKLQKEINDTLADLKAEGVIDSLEAEWIDRKGTQAISKNPNADKSKGILKVITSSDQEPFTYMKNNEIVGFDIELVTLVGERLGYEVQIHNADFESLVPSVTTGKSDIAVGCITITPERAQSVLFSEPVYSGGTVAVVAKSENSGSTSFINKISDSFKRTFITENRWKLIVDGLFVTIQLSLFSIILGTILGFFISFPLRSKNKFVSSISNAISTFLGGMPLILILMVLYYLVFSKSAISAVWIGIFGFTIDFANTVAGLLNTGVTAVDKGQLEAADAFGYKKWQIFCKITLPQAAKQMFSQYQGAIVGLVKGTAIIGYITVQDLTKATDIIRSRTYEAFFPLLITAIIYFIIAQFFVFLLSRVDIKLDPKRRKRKIKGVEAHD